MSETCQHDNHRHSRLLQPRPRAQQLQHHMIGCLDYMNLVKFVSMAVMGIKLTNSSLPVLLSS